MKSSKLLKTRGKASLTVEAALVLPIFIFAILAFIYFLQILIIHDSLQEVITEIGLNSAKYGYVYDSLSDFDKESKDKLIISTGETEDDGIIDSVIEREIARSIDSAYFKLALYDKLNIDKVNSSCIKDGFTGISTYFSSYMEEDNNVDLIINYKIKIPTVFIKIDGFQIVQRVKLRGWNGYQPDSKIDMDLDNKVEQDERTVYITTTGMVYHTSNHCTHLSLSIRDVPFDQLKDLRNHAGGKYKNCNLCSSQSQDINTAYITIFGDRYHSNKGCSGLKRTIEEVAISQVGDRRLCKRCGK